MKIKGTQVYVAALTLSLLFLGFSAGIAVAHYKMFPFHFYRNAYVGLRALYHTHLAPFLEKPQDNVYLYGPNRLSGTGVLIHDESAAHAGLTLYSSSHAQKAFLVSMDGRVEYEWGLPFSEVWENAPHVPYPVPDEFIHWRKLHLFPNGDLLATYEAPGRFPYGYGLVKIDKESRLLWKYSEMVHHDLDVGTDGSIYTLIHDVREQPVAGVDYLGIPAVIDDAVVVLSPDGNEIKRISILDAFYKSDYAWMLRWVRELDNGDVIHTNSVSVLANEISRAHSYIETGQLLLSLRHTDALAVLDPESGAIVWATLGPWRLQHDADFLANGNILVFDNVGHLGRGGGSRVIEFDPTSLGIAWEYAGDERHRFYSQQRSGQQRLANGNTLIVETDVGRMFEVTADKRIVWEYVNPVQFDGRIAAILDATRVNPSRLTFLVSQ